MSENRRHWANERKIKKHQHEQYNFLKLAFHMLAIVFVAAVLHILLFSKFMRISEIDLNGIIDINELDIRDEIEGYTVEKYWNVFFRKNYLVFSSRKLEIKLKDRFKKIQSVEVVKRFPNKVSVFVKERNSLLVVRINDDYYAVDESGVAYEKININSLNLDKRHLVTLRDLSGRGVNEGDKIIKEDYEDFVLEIEDSVWNYFGISMEGEYQTVSRLSEEVTVRTIEGWDLLLNSNIAMDKSMKILKIFLDEEKEIGNREDLEYIDLRIEDKVFYKYKGAENDDITIKDERAENTEPIQGFVQGQSTERQQSDIQDETDKKDQPVEKEQSNKKTKDELKKD